MRELASTAANAFMIAAGDCRCLRSRSSIWHIGLQSLNFMAADVRQGARRASKRPQTSARAAPPERGTLEVEFGATI